MIPRDVTRSALRGALLACLGLCLPGAVRAEDEPPPADHQVVPEAQWGKLPAAAAGQKLYLEGRWHQCFGEKVTLWRSESTRGFLLVESGSPIHEFLVKDRDSRNQPLKPGKSTVRLEGVAEAAGQGCVVRVKRVIKLQDDVDRYMARLVEARTPDALGALARESRAQAERWQDEELRQFANLVARKELAARQAELAPGDAAGAEALGLRMLEIGDKSGAVKVMGEAERQASGPGREKLRQRLLGMGAVETHGTWLLRDVYRAEEGFVQQGGVWVRREKLEFDAVRAAELKEQKSTVEIKPVRGSNGHALAKEAEAGRLSRGQTMPEVHLAAGLPVAASHLEAPDGLGQPARWSQWLMGDGRRVYFLNGEAITVLGARDPWRGQGD